MDAQMKKGFLDAYVLAFIKRNDAYGYKIVQNLSAFIEITESTLYPIVRRLQKKGCLNTYTLERNGRKRIYYHITEYGSEYLAKLNIEIKKLTWNLGTLISRAEKRNK